MTSFMCCHGILFHIFLNPLQHIVILFPSAVLPMVNYTQRQVSVLFTFLPSALVTDTYKMFNTCMNKSMFVKLPGPHYKQESTMAS